MVVYLRGARTVVVNLRGARTVVVYLRGARTVVVYLLAEQKSLPELGRSGQSSQQIQAAPQRPRPLRQPTNQRAAQQLVRHLLSQPPVRAIYRGTNETESPRPTPYFTPLS